MDPRKFVVHNQTRKSSLSPSVTSVNAALEPLKVLKVLIEGLPLNSRTGLWLTNFKGVPVARTLSPFDLIYLDKEQRVIHGIELSKDGEFAPFKGTPASALVLPPKSLTASQTRDGDQLTFTALEAEAPIAAETAPPASTTAAEPALEPAVPSVPIATEPSQGARFFSVPSSEIAPKKPEPEAFPNILRSASSTASTKPSTGFSFPVAPISRSTTPQVPPEANKAEEPSLSAPLQPAIQPPTLRPSPLPDVPPVTLSVAEAPASVVPPAADSEEAEPLIAPSRVIDLPPAPAEVPEHRKYGRGSSKKYSWKIRLLRWMFPELVIQEPEQPLDRRRADRQTLPGLIAYYFTGGPPEPQKIANISVTGFYLHTDERWMPGTIVRMTLQRVGAKGDDPADTLTVNSRIVRWGEDGEGFEFILADPEE